MSIFETEIRLAPARHSLLRNGAGAAIFVVDEIGAPIDAPIIYVDLAHRRVFLKPNDDTTVTLDGFDEPSLEGVDGLSEVKVAEMNGAEIARFYSALVATVSTR